MNRRKIRTALISVFTKENLGEIVRILKELNIEIYSTGGTQKFIAELGIEVNKVEDLTSYPSILGGRVKTLHPKVFGGILARRDVEEDLKELEEFEVPEFDLVVVDLYPFEETLQDGGLDEEIIEKIDIGGVSLIRAAAKNFNDVLIISNRDQYEDLTAILVSQNGASSVEDRKRFALEAFDITSHYDTAIFNYFNQDFNSESLKISSRKGRNLRYGENPHQKGKFFGDLNEIFEQINGKEISYNNLIDIEAAINLMSDFNEKYAFGILKHNSACGFSIAKTVKEAYKKALQADNNSAFGGVLITNGKVDIHAATIINELFFEVLIAPEFDTTALDILKSKKKRIIILQKNNVEILQQHRSLLNGIITQDKDLSVDEEEKFRIVTNSGPTKEEILALSFASRICKHTKSNAIVLAKNNQLLASGVGQTSRVDALEQAIKKAERFGFMLKSAVMASDAFFPFSDCVEIAGREGISAVIQPGGSIKDKESIDYCNQNGMSMIFTGTRHFKH